MICLFDALQNSENLGELPVGHFSAKYLLLIQSSPNFNCRWGIYTGIEKNLFRKKMCIFKEVINVTKVYHWIVVYH